VAAFYSAGCTLDKAYKQLATSRAAAAIYLAFEELAAAMATWRESSKI